LCLSLHLSLVLVLDPIYIVTPVLFQEVALFVHAFLSLPLLFAPVERDRRMMMRIMMVVVMNMMTMVLVFGVYLRRVVCMLNRMALQCTF
jgi:hypothetical protein